MENIRKRSVKSYILFESLLVLFLLALLANLVLGEIRKSRSYIEEQNRTIEALNVAQMALDSDLNNLSINGVQVRIIREDQKIIVMDQEKELLTLEKQALEKQTLEKQSQ